MVVYIFPFIYETRPYIVGKSFFLPSTLQGLVHGEIGRARLAYCSIYIRKFKHVPWIGVKIFMHL